MARRSREQAVLDLVASERLGRLVEVISLAYAVFEQPASTEAWPKAPHPPLLHQPNPLQHCRTAIDAGQGAAPDGQRWNQPGERAVYLGMTPEITVLELLVHLNGMLSALMVPSGYDLPDRPSLTRKPIPTIFLRVRTLSPMARPAPPLPATGCGVGSS